MIDEQRYALAQATVSMGSSHAFADMLNGIKADCEKAEKAAALADPRLDDRARANLFITWQVWKQTVMAIEETITNAQAFVNEANEERENERAIERDRGTRGGWTA